MVLAEVFGHQLEPEKTVKMKIQQGAIHVEHHSVYLGPGEHH